MLPQINLGSLTIFTYPLFFGLAWGYGFNYCKKIFNPDRLKNYYFFISTLFVSSWLGAKILFLIISNQYDPSQLAQSSSFWLGGGFVFYGGLILGLITTYVFIKANRIQTRELIKFLPALPIAHGIGRIGCFLAGCCFGKESSLISFYKINNHSHLPIQLLEAFFLFVAGFWLDKRKEKLNHAYVYGFIIYYSIVRFFIEFLRGDEVRGIYYSLSTSQWISIVLILISLILIKKGAFRPSIS